MPRGKRPLRHGAAIRIKTMKRHLKGIGLGLVALGALTLVASQLAGWTDHNWVQLAGLGLIVAGIVGHVAALKGESRY